MTKCFFAGCQCSDLGCNHSNDDRTGDEYEFIGLIRVGYQDSPQFVMCSRCADDALLSGVFAIDSEY